jgi:peptidoglycan/xylan/chitin deacetylase (PgdA/CDA1 family)
MCTYAQHGLLIRVVYLLVALLWWLAGRTAILLRGGHRGVIVLCYHGIPDRDRSRFAWQMSQVADRAIDAADVEHAEAAGDRRLHVCVTFDDAFANLLRNALPIMQQLEIPATIFAVTGNLDDTPRWPMPPDHPEACEPIMSASQIARTQSSLCRIGSHTLTHPDLTSLSPPHLRKQLVQSRRQLRQLLQLDVEDLALPFGACNSRVLSAARDAGYRRVFTLEPCFQTLSPGVIGRFSMTPDAWRCEFRLTCAGAYAWLRPWRRFLRRLRHRHAPKPAKEPALV